MRFASALRRPAFALAALLLVVPGLGASEGAPAEAPRGLTVNGLTAPLDLGAPPRFGWHVGDGEQTAYEIVVASTLAAAEAGQGDVWASGKVASAEQINVLYAGPELAAAERYFWAVRTWDALDRPSPWSTVAAFGTGPGESWSSSVPIWAASPAERFTDYTLTTRLTIDEVALGLRFRAPSPNDGYMWQLRGGDNRLVPHRLLDGTFTVIESVDLPPDTLAIGREATVSIEAIGATIRTFIDGALVHTLEDATFAQGGVGVRTGNSESGSLADWSVVDTSGAVLLQTDFPDGDQSLPCGSVQGGELTVPRAAHCLNAGLSVDWAFLRKRLTLPDKPIAWATVFAAAESHLPAKQYVYKLYVNGDFVGLGPTHALADEARYDGVDVSAQLVPGGENALGVLAYTTTGQALQAELVVEYTDGSREIIGTDPSWKAISGDFAFPAAGSIGTSYYAAPRENLDARDFPFGFDAPGFDDSAWPSAAEKPAFARLAPAPIAKVVEQRHAPVRIVEKAPGHYFVDFGRSWVGGVEYDVAAASAGSSVELRFGEVTSAPDTVRYQLNTGNTYQDIVTLQEGAQRLRTWGMRVFRYLEIIGAPEPVSADNLAALALVYPWDTAQATFTASSPELEQVWQLSKNTIEAVNVNFYTDSWTRERTNYEADAYLQLLSSLYLMDDLSLGRYSTRYFEERRTWPTEWPLYVILAAHDAWMHTGDDSDLARAYPSLKAKLPEAWFEPETGLVHKTSGSNGCNSTTDCDIVDWPESQRDGFVFQQYNTVVNALSYRAYRDLSALAEALGEDADALAFAERAETLRAAINARLYVPELGRYDDGLDAEGRPTGHHSLHASAFALAFGVPDEAEAPRVAEYVASRGMACSVYCAPFLLSGLYAAGGGDTALALLTSSGTASWLNMIALGAGATAEAWDPSLKGNLTYSHPWAASPAFVIPAGLFGIRPLEPGFARFGVRPQPGGLEHASITVPTVRGTIGAAFAYSPDGSFRLALQVPGNTTAELSIPVPDDTTAIAVNGVSHAVQPRGGYATLSDVGPGCRVLGAEGDADALLDERLLQVCSAAPATGGEGSAPSEPGGVPEDGDDAANGGPTSGDGTPGAARRRRRGRGVLGCALSP